MNITKRYESAIGMNYFTVYWTMSALLIAALLIFSTAASARAAEFLSADKIEGQETIGQAALAPKPEFTPDKVVRIQLNALAQNNTPYRDAGIEIAFRFASPANKQSTGPLNRFIQLVHNPVYKPMLDHQTARFGDLVVENGQAYMPVFLTASDGKQVGYVFILSMQSGGVYDQCWMTDAVLQIKSSQA